MSRVKFRKHINKEKRLCIFMNIIVHDFTTLMYSYLLEPKKYKSPFHESLIKVTPEIIGKATECCFELVSDSFIFQCNNNGSLKGFREMFKKIAFMTLLSDTKKRELLVRKWISKPRFIVNLNCSKTIKVLSEANDLIFEAISAIRNTNYFCAFVSALYLARGKKKKNDSALKRILKSNDIFVVQISRYLDEREFFFGSDQKKRIFSKCMMSLVKSKAANA